MRILTRFLALCLLVQVSLLGFAQPAEQPVRVIVTPDVDNWQRALGQPVRFRISVMRNGSPMRDARIVWQAGPERMKPLAIDSATSADGSLVTPPLSLREPGFLRCTASVVSEGRRYRGLATVGYDMDKILPTVQQPADFDRFWGDMKKELAALPIDARLLPLPERGSSATAVYQLSVQNLNGSRIYGILCVPRKPGKYPAILQVPGAGVRPYNPDLELADRGVIVLTIGIHGIPVTMDPGLYQDLGVGALRGYFFANIHDRSKYYYRRVYAGCVRAVDYIFSMPEFDGTNLGVSGNSQGGALSIITAGLDKRVKCLAAVHPALCDLTGYLQGRAGGWPHVFAEGGAFYNPNPAIRETVPYYDVVNFARELTQPGWYTWGFNDETCPPTSMYAAYNAVKAPKETYLQVETGHWFYPEQRARMNDWLLQHLK
jgi:cephalosporin-C deacetylase-like acetyl esterase